MTATPDPALDQVRLPGAIRVMFRSAATAAWYDIADGPLAAQVVAQLRAVAAEWNGRPGVRLLGSLDNDLFLVGEARDSGRWSIHLLYEIDDVATVVEMVDTYRRGTPRLDRYFVLEAVVGRRFDPFETLETTR